MKQVDDATELRVAVIWLRKKRALLDAADGEVVARVFVKPHAREGLAPRVEKRPIEAKFKELAAAGKTKWTAQCDEIMVSVKNPHELLVDYHANRTLVARVMGDQR